MNRKDILIINTGGTFNKFYNPINGELEIDCSSKSLISIMQRWLCEFSIVDIIGKDSLDFSDSDRELLLNTIKQNSDKYKKFVIIHGTDTMDISSCFIASSELDMVVVFCGAMMPYSIDGVEATANLASAIGFATAMGKSGVYIAMNGVFGDYKDIKKDRARGRFTN